MLSGEVLGRALLGLRKNPIVLGIVALNQIKQTRQGGQGLAIAGIADIMIGETLAALPTFVREGAIVPHGVVAQTAAAARARVAVLVMARVSWFWCAGCAPGGASTGGYGRPGGGLDTPSGRFSGRRYTVAECRKAADDVREKVALLKPLLNEDVKDARVMRFDPASRPIYSLALTSPNGTRSLDKGLFPQRQGTRSHHTGHARHQRAGG